jgi:hypothetical protein
MAAADAAFTFRAAEDDPMKTRTHVRAGAGARIDDNG